MKITTKINKDYTPKKLMSVVKDELKKISETWSPERLTEINFEALGVGDITAHPENVLKCGVEGFVSNNITNEICISVFSMTQTSKDEIISTKVFYIIKNGGLSPAGFSLNEITRFKAE